MGELSRVVASRVCCCFHGEGCCCFLDVVIWGVVRRGRGVSSRGFGWGMRRVSVGGWGGCRRRSTWSRSRTDNWRSCNNGWSRSNLCWQSSRLGSWRSCRGSHGRYRRYRSYWSSDRSCNRGCCNNWLSSCRGSSWGCRRSCCWSNRLWRLAGVRSRSNRTCICWLSWLSISNSSCRSSSCGSGSILNASMLAVSFLFMFGVFVFLIFIFFLILFSLIFLTFLLWFLFVCFWIFHLTLYWFRMFMFLLFFYMLFFFSLLCIRNQALQNSLICRCFTLCGFTCHEFFDWRIIELRSQLCWKSFDDLRSVKTEIVHNIFSGFKRKFFFKNFLSLVHDDD